MAHWTLINSNQSPIAAGAFQRGPFQRCFEQDVFQLPLWIAINDAQGVDKFGGFQVGDFQDTGFEQGIHISSWNLIDDSQAPLVINGAFQRGPFQKCFEQGISQLPIWVDINDSQ